MSMELVEELESTTTSLQVRCATIAPHQQEVADKEGGEDVPRVWAPLSAMVLDGGIEPAA